MEYTELVENCKLVRTRSEVNGHDCWCNTEFSTQKYVWFNGKMKDVYDSFYIIHDGKEVKEVISSKFLLECRQREIEHLAKTGFSTPREYAAYLKGRAEIENNPELLQEKIQELRTKKLRKLKND